ncbi:ATP-binding protein [Desulfonatronovibrio hydrogenovorans]|uniref:ATP-binding protein n=1 Tax=Desulfonatronovibrio hydrogenovorans TaxID=53245 RepID=UPI00048C53B4|nr:ATP-binding protein [Desulfonatronovibrio hydrogenovorans]
MTRLLPDFLHGLKFRTKITLGVAGMLVFCGLGIGIILSNMSSKALLEEGRKRGMALTSGLAFRMAEPILAMDFLQMKNLIDNVHGQYEDVVYVFLTDASDNILSHTFSGGFPTDLLTVNLDGNETQPVLLSTEQGLIYDFNAKVALGERNLGTVRLGLSRSEMDAQIHRQRLTSLFSTLGVVGLGVLLASWFSRTVTYRLNRLRESAEEVVMGNLDVQAGFNLDQNCWQIMNCQRKECPAYGDVKRRCWYLAGTLCPDCKDREYPYKMDSCRSCPVYKHNFGDEIQDLAEAFDVMAITIKTHIEELTEREKTIARQQGLLKTIMNVTPDFITLQDKDLRYKFASKAFCDYFHLKENEVVGKTDFDIFSGQQADLNYHEDMQILITGQALSKEITFDRPEGRKWLHVIKVPVYDQDESIIGLLLTARDITMLKKYQEQLIQSQKMEDLGRLAGGVAHEINTPLGIILGYAQLLMEDIEDEDLLDDLKIIEKQTKVCRKIVADLLGFSRYSQSATETVDVNESIQEVIKLVEHIFSLNHIKILNDLDRHIPPLTGDKERLKQVWLNMLNNAADAIGQDGAIYIKSKLCAHRQRLVVSIADTGKGIEDENLSKIFDPFFTTKQVGKGTGLGLSVSFGIIKDHGGKISALSPPPVEYLPDDFPRSEHFGPGTVFIIELPLDHDQETDTEDKNGEHCRT